MALLLSFFSEKKTKNKIKCLFLIVPYVQFHFEIIFKKTVLGFSRQASLLVASSLLFLATC